MKRAAALLAVLSLAIAAPALADQGMDEHEENPAQTADALALQALAILDAGLPHEEAIEKLDEAIEAGEPGEADLRAIRAAHSALHQEEVEQGHQILHEAFPGTPHLVGVTFRPLVGGAQIAAGAAGAVLLGLAAVGLVRRRRAERTVHVSFRRTP